MSENTQREGSSNCRPGWIVDRNTRLKRERGTCLGTSDGAKTASGSNACSAAGDVKRSRCACYTATQKPAPVGERDPVLPKSPKREASSVQQQVHIRKPGQFQKCYYGKDHSETAFHALRRTLGQRRLDDISVTLQAIQILGAGCRPMTFSELDNASKTRLHPPYHHRNDAQVSEEVQTRGANRDNYLMGPCKDLLKVDNSGIVEFCHEDMRGLVSSADFQQQFGLRSGDEILAAICIQHLGCGQEVRDDMASIGTIPCPVAKPETCTLRDYARSFWREHYFKIRGGSQLIHSLLHETMLSSLSTEGPLETRCQRGCNIVLFTGLEMAATHDLLVVGKAYVEMGAEVRQCTHSTHTPLHTAAANSGVEMIKFLLECGADPNAVANHVLDSRSCGCSATDAAVSATLALRSLEHKQCHCWRCCDCFSGRTPLHLAAATGREESVKLLVAGGADINLSTKRHGDTALHLAARSGKLGIVQLLLASGSELGRQNSVGATALQSAKTGHHYLVAKLLVAAAPPVISEPAIDTIYVDARHDRDQSTSPIWRMHSLSLEDKPPGMSVSSSKTVRNTTRLTNFDSTNSGMFAGNEEPLAREESWIMVDSPADVLQDSR